MTYYDAARRGEALLRERGVPDAGQDAWLLLSSVCGIDRNFYYLRRAEEMDEGLRREYESLLLKRARRVPLQHLTGEQEFMGLSFLASPDALIPRQDTEILAQEALKRIRAGMDVLDLCTGSGCIAISLLALCPGIRAVASDLSGPALAVARENAKRNRVNAKFVQGDLFEKITGRFDLIVSNPPYIPSGDIPGLMPEVRDFEPRLALDGKEDGLAFYRRIIKQSKKYLKPDGVLMFEIGFDQGDGVSGLMRDAGFSEITVVKDLAGLDRVVSGGNYV